MLVTYFGGFWVAGWPHVWEGAVSFDLPRVPFEGCCRFVYLAISLLVLRAGYGIRLYQFRIIAHLFTLLLHSLS